MSKRYIGQIWHHFRNMHRNMQGISCHRHCFIKDIHLDDTPYILIALSSSLLSLRSKEQIAAVSWGCFPNKPAIMLALCASHSPTRGEGIVLSLILRQLKAFTLNQVPPKYTICARRIYTGQRGLFSHGTSDNNSRSSSLLQIITNVCVFFAASQCW